VTDDMPFVVDSVTEKVIRQGNRAAVALSALDVIDVASGTDANWRKWPVSPSLSISTCSWTGCASAACAAPR
jgi:hypothetical protein